MKRNLVNDLLGRQLMGRKAQTLD